MDNNNHLLIETPDGNLSRAMRQLKGIFYSTAKKGKKQDLTPFFVNRIFPQVQKYKWHTPQHIKNSQEELPEKLP